MQKVDRFLGKVLEWIIAVSLAVTVTLTFVQVLFRYVLKQPLSWSQEVLMISFVCSILFGAALAIKNSEHLQVDIFDNAPPWLRKAGNVVEFTVVGIVIVLLIYYGWVLVEDNLASGQILGTLPIKRAYIYMILPLSGIFMLYFHLKKVKK